MRNLLISSLLFDTREVPYLENLTNFREYSLTVIELCLRLMNSSTLASLISLGKNLPRKRCLTQHSCDLTFAKRSVIVIHHVIGLCNIFELVGSSSAFSVFVAPMVTKIFCISSIKSCGSSEVFKPVKIIRFILVKSRSVSAMLCAGRFFY